MYVCMYIYIYIYMNLSTPYLLYTPLPFGLTPLSLAGRTRHTSSAVPDARRILRPNRRKTARSGDNPRLVIDCPSLDPVHIFIYACIYIYLSTPLPPPPPPPPPPPQAEPDIAHLRSLMRSAFSDRIEGRRCLRDNSLKSGCSPIYICMHMCIYI